MYFDPKLIDTMPSSHRNSIHRQAHQAAAIQAVDAEASHDIGVGVGADLCESRGRSWCCFVRDRPCKRCQRVCLFADSESR